MKRNERVAVAVAAVVAIVAVAAFVVYRNSSTTTVSGGDTGQSQEQLSGPGGMGAGGSGKQSTGKPTPVPKGMSLNQYVTKAYTLLKQKNYKEAFKLQPPTVQANGYDSFASSRRQMPLTSFEVGPIKQKGKTATVEVIQVLGGQAQGGAWVTGWVFTRTNGQWAAVKTEVGMK